MTPPKNRPARAEEGFFGSMERKLNLNTGSFTKQNQACHNGWDGDHCKSVFLIGCILVDTSKLEFKPHANLDPKSVNIPKFSTIDEWLIAWKSFNIN